MKRYRNTRDPLNDESRSLTRFTAALAGCALALLSGSGLAYAEDTAATPPAPKKAGDADELAEIEVTGIRAAIQSAIEVKRESGSIVEAVSAEDIGKLPDTSIAESISRLPGLTSQRANGRASAISLRGTDPAFTNALLNGREQVSTGDNRSIEFDQYPSELLSGVVVYKTPDAQLIGQGLAGTIDLRTQRPLEYGKRAIVLNVRGEKNSNRDLGANSKDHGYRASFSYIDQFFDNTFGIAVGYARLDSPLATEGVGAYEPWHANTNTSNGVPIGTFVTDGMKVRADMGKNVRDGAMAALEWRPNEAFTSTIDLYYTKSDETDDARSLEWNLSGYPAAETFTNQVIANNTLVGATVANVRPLVRNFQFITDDRIKAFGWNNKWTPGDWTFDGDLSYSKATRDQFQPETNAQYGTCANAADPACLDTGTYRLDSNHMPTGSFGLNYADPTQVAFGPTIYGAGYVKKPHVEDELKSARIDVSRSMGGWFDSVAVGLNYSHRSKDKISPESSLETLNPGAVSIDPQYLYSPTNLGYAGTGQVLAWNVPAVLNAYYQPINYHLPTDPGFSYLVGKAWTVTEKVATGSIRGNLNHELSSNVTLKGNVGLQIIKTDQSSDSFFIDDTRGGAVTAFRLGKKYTDVLPQINLAFLLPNQQSVRVGLAREMARPRMDQLKASTEFGVDQVTGKPGGSAGNPLLDPWRANAVDLSYEKYFDGNKGYFSAAAFFKKLTSYIYATTNENYDFSGRVADLPPGYVDPTILKTTGPYSLPLNGNGGNLKGVEFSLSLPGDLLVDALRNFGAILSISMTDSSITIQDPPSGSNSQISTTGLGTISLPGLSKTVWNATLFYENAGFSARVATRARSKYIGEITNYSNDRSFRFVKGDQITDAQTGYEFQEGRLKGLSILFQVNNLTNEPYVAYAGDEARLIDYQTYGRQFLLGVNLKL